VSVVAGADAVAVGPEVVVCQTRDRRDDGVAAVFPVAEEKVLAEVTPANVVEETGCPAWPSTTPEPASTGTARTSDVTTVLTKTPSASRALR
jgi:hypothetical protein